MQMPRKIGEIFWKSPQHKKNIFIHFWMNWDILMLFQFKCLKFIFFVKSSRIQGGEHAIRQIRFAWPYDRSGALRSRVPWHQYHSKSRRSIHEHWVLVPWSFMIIYSAISPYPQVLMSAHKCSWVLMITPEWSFTWFSNKRNMLSIKMTAS